MTIQLHIPETTDEGIKEAALAKGTVSQLSNVILLKHVEKVFCGVLRSQQKQFTDTEVKVLSTILNWLDGKEEMLANDKVEEVNQLITKKEFEDCCICHSVLKEEEMTLVCHNGHVFGMCCLTFLPCSAAYRTCVSCNTLASSSEKLKGILFQTFPGCPRMNARYVVEYYYKEILQHRESSKLTHLKQELKDTETDSVKSRERKSTAGLNLGVMKSLSCVFTSKAVHVSNSELDCYV